MLLQISKSYLQDMPMVTSAIVVDICLRGDSSVHRCCTGHVSHTAMVYTLHFYAGCRRK